LQVMLVVADRDLALPPPPLEVRDMLTQEEAARRALFTQSAAARALASCAARSHHAKKTAQSVRRRRCVAARLREAVWCRRKRTSRPQCAIAYVSWRRVRAARAVSRMVVSRRAT
jgi:hypothetical protein